MIHHQNVRMAVPEMESAVLYDIAVREMRATLPVQFNAEIMSEMESLIALYAQQVVRECRHDPAHKYDIIRSAVAEFSRSAQRAMEIADERSHVVKQMASIGSGAGLPPHRVRYQLVTDGGGVSAESLTEADTHRIATSVNGLFEEKVVPEHLVFTQHEGRAFWRVLLEGEGRFAMVPVEGIRLVGVTMDYAGRFQIIERTMPVLASAAAGAISYTSRQFTLSRETLFGIVGGAVLSIDSLLEQLQSQELFEQLWRAHQREQEQKQARDRIEREEVRRQHPHRPVAFEPVEFTHVMTPFPLQTNLPMLAVIRLRETEAVT